MAKNCGLGIFGFSFTSNKKNYYNTKKNFLFTEKKNIKKSSLSLEK